jgi:hypothetical protein
MGLAILKTIQTSTPTLCEPFVKVGRILASAHAIIGCNSFNKIAELEGFFVNGHAEAITNINFKESKDSDDKESVRRRFDACPGLQSIQSIGQHEQRFIGQ